MCMHFLYSAQTHGQPNPSKCRYPNTTGAGLQHEVGVRDSRIPCYQSNRLVSNCRPMLECAHYLCSEWRTNVHCRVYSRTNKIFSELQEPGTWGYSERTAALPRLYLHSTVQSAKLQNSPTLHVTDIHGIPRAYRITISQVLCWERLVLYVPKWVSYLEVVHFMATSWSLWICATFLPLNLRQADWYKACLLHHIFCISPAEMQDQGLQWCDSVVEISSRNDHLW
jgi:hypothetical protein